MVVGLSFSPFDGRFMPTIPADSNRRRPRRKWIAEVMTDNVRHAPQVHDGPSSRYPLVPYINAWSEEEDPPGKVIEIPGRGLVYADELVTDRDDRGVLWFRTISRPRQGRPNFQRVHPLRQRRAMRRLLCQVCAEPADMTEDGVLWLLKDQRTGWPGWPKGMGVTEPPVCLSCVPVAARQCPALRKGRFRRIAKEAGLARRIGRLVGFVTALCGCSRTVG